MISAEQPSFCPAKPSWLMIFTLWLVVIGGVRLLGFLDGIAFVHNNMLTFTAMLQIYPPLLLYFTGRLSLDWFRTDRQMLLRGLSTFAITSLVIFPAALVANHYYQLWFWRAAYHPAGENVMPLYVLTQILLVAFPEEFFFRGTLQSALIGHLPPQRRLWGIPFGLAHVLTAALFALSHSLIQMRWWHAFIFFPALIFGGLREWSGSIWAGTLFHAACNIFSYWVFLHY